MIAASDRAASVSRLACVALAVLATRAADLRAQPASQPTSQPATRPARVEVFKATVEPHWLDAQHFWYRNDLAGGTREFILVDAEHGTRGPAFDQSKLADALSKESGQSIAADRLPVEIRDADGKTMTFAANGVVYQCDLSSYALTKTTTASMPSTQQATTAATQSVRGRGRRGANGPGGSQGVDSVANAGDIGWPAPLTAGDGQHTLALHDHNVYVKSADGSEKPLSTDGTSEFPYERAYWSDDAAHVVAYRMERGDHKPVYLVQSSPPGANDVTSGPVHRAVLHEREYTLPGDKLDSYQIELFDASTGAHITPKLDRIDANEWGDHPNPSIRWRPDGRHFLYEKFDRGHQRVRVIEVDSVTGETRDVIDEQSKTFIWTAHIENLRLRLFNYLANGKEMIYVSEKSGWRMLYLVDIDAGTMKPITTGEWVIRGIDKIDEANRQVWFNASGVYPGQDPYLIHYGRVNFDGSGLVWLTSADGNHTIDFTPQGSSFSPDGKYLVVTHSRVDLPPVTELRCVSDGSLVCELEKAQVGEGWRPPEVFVAKGRDDQTDIWGTISRPRDFDPNKKYPIIEDIYGGPQSSYTPKTFSPTSRYEALTNLGFIVVKLDGMGTANRSKAFHDVCWHNLADAGFPDRIKWIKAAAAKYPYIDLDRVGIFGTSAGGQEAAAAVIFHGDFYKVAVANSGCHDNRMDKVSWNEQWMGYPIGPQYSACSNIDNAAKLTGRLQLVVGELDDNVPTESTYRLVDALIRNRKEFEFVFVPNANHGAGSPITQRKQTDFFQRYLQGVEPANPNDH